MGIERNGENNEVQQQSVQELRQNQVENHLEEANRQGKELGTKDSLDVPKNPEQHNDNQEDSTSKRSHSLDEKNSIEIPADEKKRFEDYSNTELQQMREENPYKFDNLNADFRERYEAEMHGMSQDEYRDYKDHLSRMNAQKDTWDEDTSDSYFDQKADQQRIAERQDAFVEKLNNNDSESSNLDYSQNYYSIVGLSEDDIQQIEKVASETGTEHTWKEFKADPDNQNKYESLVEAKDAYQKLVKEQSPWPDKEPPEFKELPTGTKFEMAMSSVQPDNKPGGFGTLSHIEDKEYVRNNLAVKEDWKPDIDRVNTYEVIKPLPAYVGNVGPQVDVPVDRYLKGGADQFEMKVHPAERMQYIKLVDSRKVE